jgi:hypothetical protein
VSRWSSSQLARVVTIALASVLMTLLLLTVEPYPRDVLGHTVPACDNSQGRAAEKNKHCQSGHDDNGKGKKNSASLAPGDVLIAQDIVIESQADQPVDVVLDEGRATFTAPPGYTAQVRGASCVQGAQANATICQLQPDQAVVFTTVATDAAAVLRPDGG